MKKSILTTIVLLLAISSSYAASFSEWWQQGNAFYQKKQYDSAAVYYEKIIALKPENANVYFNLGDTYYRLNEIPQAILCYQKALFIDPNNKKAAENLQLSQSRISNGIPIVPDIFFVGWWHSLTEGTKAGTWAGLSMLCFAIIILCFIAKRLGKGPSIRPQVIGLLVVCWLAFIILAFSAADNLVNSRKAVVMQKDAPLMNNTLTGHPLNLVPEGTTVEELSGEKNGWIKVRLPDDRSGWMQLALLAKI